MVRFCQTHLFSSLLIFVFSFGGISASQAKVQAPDELLKGATHDMFTELNAQRKALRNNPQEVKKLVEKILLPHIDIISASKWVLGKHWRSANREQKLGFIREFRTLLLRFYSSALAEYLDTDAVLDEKIIHYFPLRDSTGEDVTVRAEVRPETGKPIPVHYSMHKTDKGWKVYDVSVEGVSVITTYKNNFAAEIKQKGIDGLIASIATRNEELLAKKTGKK